MNSNFKAHVVQTVAILLPTLGGLLWIYVTMHTDLSEALKDNIRQDREIVEIRKDEKDFATDTRRIYGELLAVLAKVQQDTAVAAALAKKK